jgi:hypothetical protein
MIEGLVAAGLLALFVGLSSRTPEVPNHNTQYCVAVPTRSNPKQERVVAVDELVEDSRCPKGAHCIRQGELKVVKNCSKGSMTTAPSQQLPLSERKAK